MAGPDFDEVRLARLAGTAGQHEPIAFTLFGRDWRCSPVVPIAAVARLDALPDLPEQDDPRYRRAVLEHASAFAWFVQACLETDADRDDWVTQLTSEPCDPETLADVVVWLAGEYAARQTDGDGGGDGGPVGRPVDEVAWAARLPRGWALEIEES